MSAWDPELGRRLLRVWAVRQWYHRAELSGAQSIPSQGAALLVSNHGRLDLDSLILMKMLQDQTRRPVRAMGDRILFRFPVVREISTLLGALEGTQDNAHRLLLEGGLVLVYPGGVPEIVTSRFGREQVRWEGRVGFARAAIRAGAPVIPVASVGVNNGHVFLTEGRWLGQALYRGLLRMGPSYDAYRDPIAWGIFPLPLPYSSAVHFPWPCKVRYVVGEPLPPEVAPEAAEDPAAVLGFARRVEQALRQLLRGHGRLDE